MKIGMSAFAWTSNFQTSHLRLLGQMGELGVSAVEIPMFDPQDLAIQAIRNAFHENQLECTVCAILPSGINPISSDRACRQASIEHLKRCIAAAAEMNAKLVGGPLFAPIGYLPPHRPTPDEWSWAVEAFQAVGDILESTDLTLSIEPVNRSETFFLRTAAEAARLCEAIGNPRIGVTVDTFHANIEERDVCAALRSLGSRLRHVHLSENERGPLGGGHVPFAKILATLKKMEYQGYLMIEGFGFSPDESESPGYLWAYPDVSPGTFAFESYRYLKALVDA